jgi:glutathione S-transferase
MSTYKLSYFNGRGWAETSRLIFAAAGQKFEDVRYEHEHWPEHKAEMPLGQMPVLEIDGTKLPQSMAIARFLANQFHLAGKNNLEHAKADAVVDTIKDLITKMMPVRMEKDETKKKELTQKFLEEELPKHLQNLEVLGKLYGNGGHFFVGGHLTWADLMFYDLTDTLDTFGGNSLNNHTWLKQNREEVGKQPKIAEYVKNRPKTPF